MVGRFVEEQDVRSLEENLCEFDSHSPSSREFGGGAVKLLRFESQACECSFRFGSSAFRTKELQTFVFVGEAFNEFHVVLAVVVLSLRQFASQFLHFLSQAFDGTEGGHGLFHDGASVLELHDLREIANRVVLAGADRPRGGTLLAAEDFQQGRFPRTVFPHECHSVLGVYHERHVREERTCVEFHRKIVYGNHCVSVSCRDLWVVL